jgi:hypothetical protein
MTEVIERGDIQFFFRPLVQPAEADAFELGVQSFFLVMSPAGGQHRRLRIGKKRMPARPRERFWARIERVGSLQRVLGDALEPESYVTKTRGERYQPGARPIAHGTYELVQHDDHIHLRYDVEPFGFEDAPEEVTLAPTADHLVLFKASPGERAVWTQRGTTAELDEEGTEIVLAGSNHPGTDSDSDADSDPVT